MKTNKTIELQVVNPSAAAIDVGSREHWCAVGQQSEDVRKFGVYTSDHVELIKIPGSKK